jgi:hypothetical protein
LVSVSSRCDQDAPEPIAKRREVQAIAVGGPARLVVLRTFGDGDPFLIDDRQRGGHPERRDEDPSPIRPDTDLKRDPLLVGRQTPRIDPERRVLQDLLASPGRHVEQAESTGLSSLIEDPVAIERPGPREPAVVAHLLRRSAAGRCDVYLLPPSVENAIFDPSCEMTGNILPAAVRVTAVSRLVDRSRHQTS